MGCNGGEPIPTRIVVAVGAVIEDALGRDDRAYLPLIGTMFVYLILSNWLGMIPGLEEPTRDINTPLSLGIMGFFIWHFAGMKAKGVFGYIKEFFQPIFLMFSTSPSVR